MSKAINVAVYCSSATPWRQAHTETAQTLGAMLARSGRTLVFGGSAVGLMQEVAQVAKANSGRVVGIIPECFSDGGIAFSQCDELVITKDLSERKHILMERADAFVILAGGFGTLDELFETATIGQLGGHEKPIAVINTEGFYSPLRALLANAVAEGVLQQSVCDIIYFAADVEDALRHIDHHEPAPLERKWI